MNIKRFFLAATLTLGLSLAAHAQSSHLHGSDFWSRVSLEAGYGLNTPVSPEPSFGKASDYGNFMSLHAGARYQIDDFWSVRGTYEMNKFEHKDDSDLGLTFHKLALEAVYDISAATGMVSDFKVDAHAGFGLGIGSSNTLNNDKVGSVQLGVMPSYALINNWSLFLDATYILNLSQDYGFDGLPVSGSENTAGIITTRIGVMYSF